MNKTEEGMELYLGCMNIRHMFTRTTHFCRDVEYWVRRSERRRRSKLTSWPL